MERRGGWWGGEAVKRVESDMAYQTRRSGRYRRHICNRKASGRSHDWQKLHWPCLVLDHQKQIGGADHAVVWPTAGVFEVLAVAAAGMAECALDCVEGKRRI